MNTTKSLQEKVNEVLNSDLNAAAKRMTLLQLGVTPYEANYLVRASYRRNPRAPRTVFAYTFGVEMETINCRPSDFMTEARHNGLAVVDHTGMYSGCHRDIPQFKLVPDGSLRGSNTAECVTPALMSDDNGFASLQACCNALRSIGASVNSSCGLHVHIGARSLSNGEYCNVFVNYMRLETAIESFLAPSRRGMNARWCKSLRRHESNILLASTKSQMRQALGYDRYFSVNAESYERHETIEFRQHQGTINFGKVSRWVKFLGKLVEYSKTNRLDHNIDRIEDIPFLSENEKVWFCARRNAL